MLGMGDRAGQGGGGRAGGAPVGEEVQGWWIVCVCVRGCWWAGWLVDGSVLTLSGCLGGRLGG